MIYFDNCFKSDKCYFHKFGLIFGDILAQKR